MNEYADLPEQLRALTEGEPLPLPNLCNAAALLFQTLPEVNWAGFYLAEEDKTGPVLVLGPFQGKTARVRIAKGEGVCGTAWERDEVLAVPDVHEFSGHIACDTCSSSEIVVPLHGADGAVVGVLDLDSPVADRFTEEDKAILTAFAREVERWCPGAEASVQSCGFAGESDG